MCPVCLFAQSPIDPFLRAAIQKVRIEGLLTGAIAAARAAMPCYLLSHVVALDVKQYRRRVDARTGPHLSNSLKSKYALIKADVTRIHFDTRIGYAVDKVCVYVSKLK